jgi:TPR repeat protein
MYMKTQSTFITVLGFYFILALLGVNGQANAQSGTNPFISGYKAYLKKDFKRALIYWRPLAEAGNLDAQYHLGNMFLNGQGVTVDWSEAGKWFRASAEQGDVGAQYLIGEMNLKGMGMVRDYQKAGNWFKKAAEQGYPDAQFRLGEWYAEGKGGVTNLLLAYVWLKLAGANGIQAGDEKRKLVETRLTAKEIKHANGLAYQWWISFEQGKQKERP